MRYYKVYAKCGHVGRGYYVEKCFAVKAVTASDAAVKVLKLPKVKKQLKNAITKIEEVDFETYRILMIENQSDIYLTAHTKSEILDVIYNERLRNSYKREKRKKEWSNRVERIKYITKKNFLKEVNVYEWI